MTVSSGIIWKSLKEKFSSLKENYAEAIFGFITGITLGVVIALVFINFLVFLVLANLVLTAMVFLKVLTQQTVIMPKTVKNERKVCPECGSPARHKKTCSRGKKK